MEEHLIFESDIKVFCKNIMWILVKFYIYYTFYVLQFFLNIYLNTHIFVSFIFQFCFIHDSKIILLNYCTFKENFEANIELIIWTLRDSFCTISFIDSISWLNFALNQLRPCLCILINNELIKFKKNIFPICLLDQLQS